MSIKEIIERMEQMTKEAEKWKGNEPIHPYVSYMDGTIDKNQFISILLEDFYFDNFKDEKIETKKLFLGTLTYIEGENRGMLLREINNENNVDEKCILNPVIKTPHNGTVFLDIINKTLIETIYGFASFSETKKTGILVESIQPSNEVMTSEKANMDELKTFINQLNEQKQKTKKL